MGTTGNTTLIRPLRDIRQPRTLGVDAQLIADRARRLHDQRRAISFTPVKAIR